MAEIIVRVEEGLLRGKEERDASGKPFYSFQGVPYARPPLGDLRFKAPQPSEKWQGIRDATKEGPECYANHMVFPHIVGAEDCLYLNVYTPQLPESGVRWAPRPVMVWIHGGGFVSGSGNIEFYGPHYLLSEEVVVVTINYRLGVLGFLSLEDLSLRVPGNAGLKDQVLALTWIKNNVYCFGGDPNNVTIFGESAGSASVHYLMMSPLAKGLFHKAIMQSGCVFNPWAWGQRVGQHIAELLGFKSHDEGQILKFLQSIPVQDLYQAQLKIKDSFRADTKRPYGPVVERVSPYERGFLCQPPLDVMLQGRYHKVPVMIGYTSREGMLVDMVRPGEDNLISDFSEAVPYIMRIPKKSPLSDLISKRIRDFYYGDEKPTSENKDFLYQLHTDNFFFRGIHTTVKLLVATSNEPVYFYRFSFEGNLNVYKNFGGIQYPGVCHADDLGYLFHMQQLSPIDPESDERRTIDRMVKMWTNFAKVGDPTPARVESPSLDVVWKPVSQNELNYLDIGKDLKVDVNPEAERMLFWDEMYNLNQKTSKL